MGKHALKKTIKTVWWLPTLGFFLFLAIELSMFAGASKHFEDPGVGRHLRTAQFILATGQIPRTDPLSFTHGGEPWFDFEWAFESTLGVLNGIGGLALVAAFCYALFGATVLGVYRTLLQSSLSMAVVLLYTGLAFLTLWLHFSVRPVLFTYLFMALVVEVWHRNRVPRLREWVLLPLIFAFWANIHAGWLAAIVFLLLGLLGGAFNQLCFGERKDDRPWRSWLVLTALCGFATLANPWHWELPVHLVKIATTYKSFALWDEYLPPNFGAPSMSAITVLVILFISLGARILPQLPRWSGETLLPVLFFLYQGLKAQRHVLLLVEVAAVPVARDLAALWQVKGPRWLRIPVFSELWDIVSDRLTEFQERQRHAGGDAWLALVTAVILALLFMRAPIGKEIEVGQTVSPQLVTFLHEHPDRFHRPLNTTWNAGPLLWNMRPGFRVSFDDRGDFYGDDTVFSFVNLGNGVPGWRETLAKGNYDSMILDPYLRLNELIHFLPEWKEVYRDDHAVVYWKDAPGL